MIKTQGTSVEIESGSSGKRMKRLHDTKSVVLETGGSKTWSGRWGPIPALKNKEERIHFVPATPKSLGTFFFGGKGRNTLGPPP